jgi:sugar O-acyltransferase (sialic acid O-acetyltransferase NeuD family)
MKNTAQSKPSKNMILIGARMDGHAGVVLDTLNELGYKLIGFIDNTPGLVGTKVAGVPVIGSSDDIEKMKIPSAAIHIAIGDNVARGKIYQTLKKIGIKVETLIHPAAIVSRNAEVKEGSFVGPRAVINNGAIISEAVLINTGAIIEHDNRIGFSAHMAPGTKTAGRVKVSEFAFVGVGATILPDITIGSGAMIGAGAIVVKDVPARTTVIGYAAKKHGKNIYEDMKPDVGETSKVYVAQPTLPEYPLLDNKFREIAKSLMLSNFAQYSTELEAETETLLGVGKALTFPNATSALMLVLKAMDLKGEVILPSFTFSATGHAVVWNGLTPVFADIQPETFNIDPKDVERKITSKTSAIIGVHCFGCPADINALETIAKKHKLKLIFDSAHALGSKYRGKAIGGFGDIECFSLSGTKVVTSAEGGIATSNNKEFMQKMHLGRNYGASGDYDCQYIGLNGKMSEFHAAIALESFAMIEEMVARRNHLAELYKRRLNEIPGISFQYVPDDCVTTVKDFAAIIDPKKFGMDRTELVALLAKENIFTKKYFYPPLHKMKAYQTIAHRAEGLNVTDYVANNIICLPMYSHMSEDTLEKVCYAVFRIWNKREKSGQGLAAQKENEFLKARS